ncbi:MAG: DUF4159 domain-containing protein [Candidatus Latescibacteria bacterium]|nr:DUF4159 domain-containing protein [Candidatus Latescibacterota bacterium]
MLSMLLHMLGLYWWIEFSRFDQEAEVFRSRLAHIYRFEPKRLTAAKPKEVPKVEMEYLAVQPEGPRDIPDANPEQTVPVPPSLEEPPPPTFLSDPQVAIGVKSDTFEVAEDGRARMVSPTEMGLARAEGREDLDLLRIEDMARANKDHAVVFPDLASRRDISGYVNFTRLRLSGVGSNAEGALDALARHLRDYTQILAQVNRRQFDFFLSEELLKDPIHFMLEGGGLTYTNSDRVTNISEEEYTLLGRYLRGGGFLYIEGGGRFRREMVSHVKSALKGEGRVFEIPATHPIYHSYYDFPGGFPGEDKGDKQDIGGLSWYYPSFSPRELALQEEENTQLFNPQAEQTDRPPPLGMWGVELNGDLVAVLSDMNFHPSWRGDIDATDAQEIDALPALTAATNIVVYALSRKEGLATKAERPAWAHSRPDFQSLEMEPYRGVEWDDAALGDQLDASLALVQSPLGSSIGDGGLRLRLDGRYSLELLRGGTNGILLHNLPAGTHWLDLEYGGKSRQVEVDLRGGRVLTLTFGLNRLAFVTQLRLKVQEDQVGLLEWLATFSDLEIEEIFLDQDNAVLDEAGEF